MQPKAHSLNSPSALRRRELCPASYWMEKDLPPETSEAAEAGTKLHECVERMLLADGEGATAAVLSDFEDLSAEQWDMVHWCVEKTRELMWSGARLMTEHYLDLRWFHPSIEGGTADLIIVEDFVRALVVDFKFGFKSVPDASDNLQLASYAEGVRHEFDVAEVDVCILQPALNRVCLGPTLQQTIERARNAASRSLNKDLPPTPNPEACQYCRASGKCPAQMSIVQAPEVLPTVDQAAVELLPMPTISEFLAVWEDRDVEGIVGSMKQRLLEACMTGYEDSRWKLGHGRSSRKFVDAAEPTLRTLAQERGKDPTELYTTPELKSVAQIESIVGKSKAVKELFDPLVTKTEGRPKLERKK